MYFDIVSNNRNSRCSCWNVPGRNMTRIGCFLGLVSVDSIQDGYQFLVLLPRRSLVQKGYLKSIYQKYFEIQLYMWIPLNITILVTIIKLLGNFTIIIQIYIDSHTPGCMSMSSAVFNSWYFWYRTWCQNDHTNVECIRVVVFILIWGYLITW